MNTYDAWVTEKRPIYSRLPDCYKPEDGEEEAISDWLTYYFDQLLIGTKDKADNLSINLDPLTCDVEWLSFLAPLCGWYGIWDETWDTEAKRTLLSNSYTLIWPNKGSLEVLDFVLDTLGVRHLIKLGQSFLVDISLVGDPIGSIAWNYDILLPSEYHGQPEYKLTERINRLFGPCWCESSIIFDDTKFNTYSLFGIGEQSVLSPGEPPEVLKL
jgi:hypothetical protein